MQPYVENESNSQSQSDTNARSKYMGGQKGETTHLQQCHTIHYKSQFH